MKKICYWSPHLSNVATIKNVINSAISLKKYKKEKVSVKIYDVVGEWTEYEKLFHDHGIEIHKFSNLKLKKFLPITGYLKSMLVYIMIFIFKIYQLKKILIKEKPDFLIVHLVTVVPLFLLILFNFETKFILRISGLPKLTFFRRLFWRSISQKVFLVTCPSQQTREDLIKQKIFDEKKLKILYDPLINLKKISEKIKEENNLDKSKPYFVSIGRLTNQKNHLLLIKAFLEVLKKNNNLYLYIVGEGENKNKLKKFINLNNLQNNVFLTGHINNIYPIIKNSLALISTSLWEDPGAVMVEASYCGKNVISSACPNGPEEFLNYGKGGYLFKNNNLSDLINKIGEFLADNESNRYKKIILCKKNTKNYTLFSHFKSLNLFLNLN